MQRRSDRGSVAVEFALVAPILFLVLFGIIEYGVWFADSITIRQSAANGARRASAWADGAAPWGSLSPCGTWESDVPGSDVSPEIQALGCSIIQNTPMMVGDVHVKILILDPTLTPRAITTWKAPNAVRVCVLQKHGSISGFVPLPKDEVIWSYADMPIESTTGRTVAAGGDAVFSTEGPWRSACNVS